MLHLHRVASHSPKTGMTAKNLAIVWAPNLIREAAAATPQTPITNGSRVDSNDPNEGSQSMSVDKLAVARASLQLNLVHNTQIVQVGILI